jgi:hypothetical protein
MLFMMMRVQRRVRAIFSEEGEISLS